MLLTRHPADRPEVRWRWLAASLVLAFGFIAMHEFSQTRVQALRDGVGSGTFHLLFGLFGVALLVASLLTSIRWLRARRAAGRLPGVREPLPTGFWVSWALLLGAILLVYWTLVAVHSELIHLLQYMLLLLALHAALGRLGLASACAFLVSVIDEGYQYWVLRRDWNSYYDFNDLVLNQLGVALGVALVLSAAPPVGEFRWRRCFGSPWTIYGLVVLGLVLGLSSGWLGLERATSPEATVVLSRSGSPPTFWTHAEWSGKDFHILAPVPGMIWTALTSLPLAFVDGWGAPRYRT